MEYLGFLLITVLAVVAVYFAIARLLGNRPAYPVEVEAFGREHNRLVEELKVERAAVQRLTAESAKFSARVETLERELTRSEQERRTRDTALNQALASLETESIAARTGVASLRERDDEILRLRATALQNLDQIAQLREQLRLKTDDYAQAAAQLQHSERANAEMKQFLADAQARLSGVFTEMAGKVFDERSQRLEHNLQSSTAQSRADIEHLLQPYAERLGEFRQRLDIVHSEETADRASLLGAVKELKTLNQDVAEQAATLSTILKGSGKARGDWGELVLESVLRSSGLVEHQHYLRHRLNKQDAAQPDVVITLPDQRKIVIDCGLNLGAWQDAMNAENQPAQDEALRHHAQRVSAYIGELSGRQYPQQIGESALEITIAFVPIEAALSAALGAQPNLQVEAFEQRVALASPNTLIALLAVVERLWNRDEIRRQALAISAAGGKVLAALTPLLQVFEKTGRQLSQAHESFAEAQRALTESSESLIPHAQRLAELGIDHDAPPQSLTPIASDSAEPAGAKRPGKRT